MWRWWIIALLLVAAPVAAQVTHPPTIAAANLPTCNATRDGTLLSVVDATWTGDCTATGGGSVTATCLCEQNPASTFTWVAITGSMNNSDLITQASHGVSAGEWVQFDIVADAWELLDIDTAHDSYAAAYVSLVLDPNNFVIVADGLVDAPSHGLTVGSLYASATAGAISSTAPALGEIEWVVGVAIDANTIIVQQKEWFR